MDPPTASPRPSGIPRPSRLPVRKPELRPAPSRENLQSTRLTVNNPRLRNSVSREQLSASTPRPRNITSPIRRESSQTFTRDREASASSATYTPTVRPLLRKPSDNALSKKPSRNFLREPPARLQSRQEVEEVIRADESSPVEEQSYGLPSRKPRPSLSERTMETLQNIPSSPAIRKRGSSFFSSENPSRPPSRSLSRPTSSSNSNTSGNSVPVDFRASTNTFRPPQTVLPPQTPMKRPSAAKPLKTPVTGRKSIVPTEASSSNLPSPGPSIERSPSPTKPVPSLPSVKSGSKTLSSKPLKPRASVNGLFRKPSMPVMEQSSELDRIGFGAEKPTTLSASSEATSVTSRSSKATTMPSGDDQDSTPKNSSLALRDQIAKAKAAKRAAAAKQEASPVPNNEAEIPVIASGTFDFGLTDDPFNQQISQDGATGLLRKRIQSARTDGRLNIAAMGFKEIPEDVLKMYNLESIGAADGSWAESVDLTKFIAADNELEVIPDNVFPDIDPKEVVDDEDAQGNQFGGLETLDLHGNVLISLPVGLRRLQHLTTLNLSNNKLANDCFHVISQLRSLRDLKMAGNGLVGPVDDSITNLSNLETLDLQRNSLTLLPDALADLVRLRMLNITENKFKSLPFETLRRLPLTEIFAAKNSLSGSLVAEEVDELPGLQILDVTSNALSSLTISTTLKFPALRQLNCSCNRLTKLPNLESWTSLVTIAAEDNNIDSIPEGFTTLRNLKNVDFNGNNLRVLDDRIGAMENLDVLRVSGNPLRDKKFSGMTTEDLKRALKARMEPEEEVHERDHEQDGAFYSAPVSPISPQRPGSSDWQVKPGGVLDRSGTQSFSLNPVAAADVAAFNQIKVVELHHNLFKDIPSGIAFFAATLTILNISHNELNSDTFLRDDLDLPVLKEFNLSSNTFNSLQPLIHRLKAPSLERLDISFNRLTSLPVLKSHFPSLATLLASHNTIRELSPESIKGLQVVDCSSNDIGSLNARIGLLGGPGGLQRLDVSGNRFRVPKYTVLEKGTEATLSWLRDRIPAGESTNATDVD